MSHWPQYTWIALAALGLGITLAKHGQPREGRHSFWATLIASAIGFWLLSMGGFFANL